MKLSSLLDSNLIEVRSGIKSREAAQKILIEMVLKDYGNILSREDIENSVNEREKLGDTLLPEGIAIPHGRIEHLEDVIVAVFLPTEPIIENGVEMKIMFLLLTSRHSSNLYLNTLSAIAKLSLDDKFFNSLIKAETPNEVISIINDSGIKIKKELKISDIMDNGIVSVTPETTLKDLIDLFSSKNLCYVPVIDSNGTFKGEVNLHDIIGAGLPEYITMIGDLSFLSTIEPFEDVLKNEEKIKVSDIMKKPALEVNPDTSIIELAFMLMKLKKRHAPVIENGDLLGIVSLTDILNKVLRAKLWI